MVLQLAILRQVVSSLKLLKEIIIVIKYNAKDGNQFCKISVGYHFTIIIIYMIVHSYHLHIRYSLQGISAIKMKELLS